MTLGDLVPEAHRGPYADLAISGLALDSRRVVPGSLFVAVPGTRVDGRAFIDQAVAAGAVAIVAEGDRPVGLDAAIGFVPVADVRRALALAAAAFFQGQPATTVAVTGTSGKSSVAEFTRQIFGALGHASASLGTIGVVTAAGGSYGSLTTPDAVTLHQTLDRLAQDGITHLAMEASSHGIEQRRLDGVRLAAAAFTNLGRDHLDYHLTTEAYLAAKLRLFETLLPDGAPAVVNADDPAAAAVIAAVRARGLPLLTTGLAGETLRLVSTRTEGFAQVIAVSAEGGTPIEVALPLVGAFQAANALVAAGLVLATDPSRAAEIVAALATLKGVPGRMERVGEARGGLAIVDYAHKPDALDNVLDALRPFAAGRLVCVLGCGGDRDRGKRPIMGRIAADKADAVIVTDDNPRSEDPATIRAAILAQAPGAREIGDRAEAIRTAVRELGAGDILVVAGKGHETGQIVGDRTLPFSDRDSVLAAIAEVEGS